MNSNNLSLRKLAIVLGGSQPFLSQIRAGKRPIPEALKKKVKALGAYHLLITDKQAGTEIGGRAAAKEYFVGKRSGGTDWVRTSDLALMKRPL